MTHSHLSDGRLMEVCLDRVPDAREQQHLESCAACETRRAGIAQLLSDVNDVAVAEADAAFPADRLARQQARILHRLEHEGRPGRVIAFPAGQGHEPTALRARPGMRWVAAAAAAGLVIGLAAGHMAHDLSFARIGPSQASNPAPAVQSLRAVSTGLSEEEFLGQLELAIEGSGSSALQPLDDLTPRVWEVAAR